MVDTPEAKRAKLLVCELSIVPEGQPSMRGSAGGVLGSNPWPWTLLRDQIIGGP